MPWIWPSAFEVTKETPEARRRMITRSRSDWMLISSQPPFRGVPPLCRPPSEIPLLSENGPQVARLKIGVTVQGSNEQISQGVEAF